MASFSELQLSQLRFFTTPSHDCSYLEGEHATTLFADPASELNTEAYTALSAAGFRRSGEHIYKPHCATCNACVPMRVPLRGYTFNRRQKRIMKKNNDLQLKINKPDITDEYYDLYERYICARHMDGDMYPPSRDQFEGFLRYGRPEASFYEFRKGKQLMAVAVADQLSDSFSAIYSFFEPAEKQRSLGSFAILKLIEHCKEMELSYLYLGYWIKQCQKMSYKMDFKPVELLIDKHWVGVED